MTTKSTVPGFCPSCGSILPMLDSVNDVQCYTCKTMFGPEVFGTLETKYVINFNSNVSTAKKTKSKKEADENEGPLVDRQCPKCGSDKMSYATLQLRSADEGQTVFYTCIKCKFKESENS